MAKAAALPVFVHQWLAMALLEDLGEGDVTTDAIPALASTQSTGVLSTREDCVVSGITVAAEVFRHVDAALTIQAIANEGDSVSAGHGVLQVSGSAASILKAERLALNLLQHLSGVATFTQQFAQTVQAVNPQCKVVHTRKTIPGLRWLQNQAVVHGGGGLHRYNLGMAAMVKDNHIAACGGDIGKATAMVKGRLSHTQTLTVEVDRLDQIEAAIAAGADSVLLDNMPPETLVAAVSQINGRTKTEASGGVTLDTIGAIAATGVDVISTSQLTMAAPPIDIGLELSL